MTLLSIAAGVSPDVAPADFVDAAAAAGWPACGVWVDPDTWTDRVAAAVRARLDDTGLVPLDIEPLFVLPDGAGGVTDNGEQVIDAAARVGARNILVVARGAERGPFVERFAELCDLTAQRCDGKVNCVVEFMAFMSTKSLGDAVDIAIETGRPNAGVLIDNLHLARTGATPDDVAAVDPALLPYVQLSDAAAAQPDNLIVEALDLRVAPGLGGLPVAEFLAALPPGTPLSLEVRSADLRGEPDPVERARRLLTDTRRFLSSLPDFDH